MTHAALAGQEIAALRELRDVLVEEIEALRRVEPDAVARLVSIKLRCLETVEGAARKRADAMAAEGFASSRSGLASWFDRAVGSAARDDYLRVAQETFNLIKLGMRLANAQLRHFERASASLRGAAGQDLTYDADGRTRHCPPPRGIARI